MTSLDYNEIRQLLQDTLSPIKDQLDRIQESLSREFVRKDALDPRLAAMQKEIDDLKDKNKQLESEVLGTPQKVLLIGGAVLGVISTAIGLIQATLK